MMYGYNQGYSCGNGLMGFGWPMIFPILIGIVIIYAVFKLVTTSNHHNVSSNHDALSLLNHKYVTGEISEEEYMKRKKMINSK